ncbi:hypothetical protein T484DRAFT_1892141, partial [Baffinella frigidus]
MAASGPLAGNPAGIHVRAMVPSASNHSERSNLDRAVVFALFLAVAMLLLAEGIPASAAPVRCQPMLLDSERASPKKPFPRRKVEATVDWLKRIVGGETRSMKQTRLSSVKETRFREEEAARCAKATDRCSLARTVCRMIAAAACTGCALVLAIFHSKAGHFLHANAPSIALAAKTMFANPRMASSLIISYAKAWFYGWQVSPQCHVPACQLLHDVLFDLGKAYSAAYINDKKEATLATMGAPIADDGASSSGEQSSEDDCYIVGQLQSAVAPMPPPPAPAPPSSAAPPLPPGISSFAASSSAAPKVTEDPRRTRQQTAAARAPHSAA